MAGRLQCVACVIPWKMVFRNTGVGTQLQSVSPDTSLFERRLPGRLRTVEEVPTARGTRRAVGAYLHTQPMPWVAARAFSGAWPSRRVPVRAVRCRARSVTKAAELLGGWRLPVLAILSMRARANAHSKGYPRARSVTPSPRMTCNRSTCAKRTACSRTTWRWNYCYHSMKQ